MTDTNAWRRVKADIDQYSLSPNPIEPESVPALCANPRGKNKMPRFNIATYNKALQAGKTKAEAKRIAFGGSTTRTSNPRKKRKKRKASRKRRRNAWPGNKAGHRRAAKKGHTKRKRRLAKRRRSTRRRNPNPSARSSNTTTSRTSRSSSSVKVVKVPGQTKVVRVGNPVRRRKSNPKRRKSNPKRRRNPARRSSTAITRSRNSGTLGGLFSNPAGPFTARSLKSYGTAALGLGLGLTGADILDRYIATRTPTDGVRPWYGRDAAAAQHRRPDAYRLGGQAALALLAMAGTYFTRRGKYLPWFFGGTAVGAGANLAKMVLDWWVAPAILKVDDPSEESLANRLFPTEQADVQDQIDAFFENYQSNPSLMEAQQPDLAPGAIQSPLGAGSAYTLGKAPKAGETLYLTGRLGKCSSCGGDGGCYGSCKDYCPPCAYNVGVSAGAAVQQAPQCGYVVQAGDNFGAIAALAGVSPDAVAALNGGGPPESFWKVGEQVKLPYALCKHLEGPGPKPGSVAGQEKKEDPQPVIPQPVPIATGDKAAEAEARAFNFGNEEPAE